MINIEFEISDPVDVVFEGKGKYKFISRDCRRNFLSSISFSQYERKQGVYIFALRSGKGYMPWYVGKTNGKRGMVQECMTPDKSTKYNEALRRSLGTPVIFFVVRPGNKYIAPKQVVNDMEKQLTQDALAKNPYLINIQNTKNLPRWSINGVVRANQGRPSQLAKAFSKMMGI